MFSVSIIDYNVQGASCIFTFICRPMPNIGYGIAGQMDRLKF